MGEDWSKQEVDSIVADYFRMLTLEIAGQDYNKAEHNRNLLPQLNDRTRGSIEFKHQNISAVMKELGRPYIRGYRPLPNFQRSVLRQGVADYIKAHPEVEKLFQKFSFDPVTVNLTQINFENFEEAKPEKIKEEKKEKKNEVEEPKSNYKRLVKINYLELEQANSLIGSSGEEIVIEYEKWRLRKEGKDSWVDKIERVSQTQGDWAGFDILSRNSNGTDRYIEVKTTKLSKEAPFFFSQNEYEFSKSKKSDYFLYRVFNLVKDPKLFIVNGIYDDFCNYEPIMFRGTFDQQDDVPSPVVD
jgi:hypothetical protein